ncbi:DUF4783 domain-containing protein [Shivajiella indica]|uniref:DUF4783 domain-containing protein n=1 Tax=Shivajiella indica TaxID=872115 RepID=A0ABW5B6F8_9BACT
MKKLLYIGVLLFLVFSLSQARSTDSTFNSIEGIVTVFQSGSSRELAKYFDSGIDININGNQGDYSKNQAELVMRDFFKKFPPVDFQLLQQGSNTDQIIYYIGNYRSEETVFRVFIKGKKEDQSIKVYSLDIVKGIK